MEKEESSQKDPGADEAARAAAAHVRAEEKTQEILDKMILDAGVNKYDLIIMARRWAYELKNKEGETRSIQALIPESIRDILTAKVNPKTIWDLPHLKSLAKKLKAPPTIAILDNIGKVPVEPDSDSSEKKKK